MNDEEIAQAQTLYERDRPRYVEFADALRVLLAQLIKDEGVDVEPVTARAKEVTSLVDKLQGKEYREVGDITDKCGVRVVTRYQTDVARVCSLIESEFAVVEVVDHGSADIQSFGYASHHLIVELDRRRKRLREWNQFHDLKAEIQVRSILQHAWASISHGLDYKTDTDVPATVRRKLFRVAALLETGDELFDDFRRDVIQLKSEYRQDVERHEWRGLALDQDSLLAAWDELPMDALTAAALANGWRPLSRPRSEAAARVDAGRLIQVATLAGIGTLGELADTMQDVAQDRDRLHKLAELGSSGGHVPFAIPPDVASLVLLARDAGGSIVRNMTVRSFRPALMQAVAELAGAE